MADKKQTYRQIWCVQAWLTPSENLGSTCTVTTSFLQEICIHLFTGVDLVKPSTIYYNSREVLTGLPGAPGEVENQRRNSSSSGSKRGCSASSMSFKSQRATDSATVSIQEDSVFGDNNVDTTVIVALEERMRVSCVISNNIPRSLWGILAWDKICITIPDEFINCVGIFSEFGISTKVNRWSCVLPSKLFKIWEWCTKSKSWHYISQSRYEKTRRKSFTVHRWFCGY